MRITSTLTALATALTLGCGAGPSGPERGTSATVTVTADVSGIASVATIVIDVTAPDFDEPLVFNLPVEGGVASGTITIPAGSDRTITMRAFDQNGVETHNGAVTIDLDAGINLSLSLALSVATTEVEIVITLEVITVTVDPESVTLATGETATLTATVTDQNGNPIQGPVAWASADPGVATVDQDGLVTAVGEGVTQIVAMFAGVAGSATVTVTP